MPIYMLASVGLNGNPTLLCQLCGRNNSPCLRPALGCMWAQGPLICLCRWILCCLALEENASYIRCCSTDKSVVNMPHTAFAMAIITDTCNVHLFYRCVLYLWLKKRKTDYRMSFIIFFLIFCYRFNPYHILSPMNKIETSNTH